MRRCPFGAQSDEHHHWRNKACDAWAFQQPRLGQRTLCLPRSLRDCVTPIGAEVLRADHPDLQRDGPGRGRLLVLVEAADPRRMRVLRRFIGARRASAGE